MSYWRDKSRAIIAKALEEADRQGLEGKARYRFVTARYPFGPREHHPYKIWLSELKRQLGTARKPRPPADEPPRQGELF